MKIRNLKRKSLLWGLVLCSVCTTLQAQEQPLYKDAKQPVEVRVEDLLRRMTVEEKAYQLSSLYLGVGKEIFQGSKNVTVGELRDPILKGYGTVSSPSRVLYPEELTKFLNALQKVAVEESRLGIPLFVEEEALHGIVIKGSSCFPQPIGMASSWNVDLMREVSDWIGKQTQSIGITHVMQPVLDLARDGRHGRFPETMGEDPYLVSRMCGEFVKEVQQENVVCAAKHFAANFVTEAGREASNIELSERALRETHLVPYEYAVKKCGVKGIMTAYNAINSVPCTTNKWLLEDVLRQDWGFDGVVVSDWSAVPHLYNFHHSVESVEEGAALSVKAGLDIDLPSGEGYVQLANAVKSGKLSEKELDVPVRRVLRQKFEMGLFEHPYVDPKRAEQLRKDPKGRELTREMARESIVLLKNDGILPIKKDVKRIAVLGPNAADVRLGGYTAYDVEASSPLEGIKEQFGNNVEIVYEKGTGIFGGKPGETTKALDVVRKSDMAILFMGGDGNNDGLATGGEAIDRMDLELMGDQEAFIQQVAALGKPVVVVLVDGRPVVVRNWIDKVNALVMMWYAGEEGGNAIAEILKGDVNPSGKLPCTFPQSTGQCPLYYSIHPQGRPSETAELKMKQRNNQRYEPQYPFGFGLSYTSFEYSNLKIEGQNTLHPTVSVEIKNTGSCTGCEVVQLYLSSKENRIVRKVKELRGFQRVSLAPSETKKIEFVLSPEDFTFLNEVLKPEIDEGDYEVLVGSNSQEGVKGILTVKL